MRFFLIIIYLVFTYLLNAQFSNLHNFGNSTNDGKFPRGSLVSDGAFLYGMTYGGGASTYGTIFKVKNDGSGYLRLMSFNGNSTGLNPYGSLVYDGAYFYGMTSSLNSTQGTIFKISPSGTNYLKLLDFNGSLNGSNPKGSLVYDGTFLYGMTREGGTANRGVVFKIKTDGTGYVKLMDFTGLNDGQYPEGSLYFDGTFLYGMTFSGGANSKGVIFKIKTDGTGFTKLLDFSGTSNGSNPVGSLISDGIYLYGMTKTGGSNNTGTAFRIKTDGTGYAMLFDFSVLQNGWYPYGDLLAVGNYLYGCTREGGSNNYGIIYKIKPDGSAFSKIFDFWGTSNGSYPHGSLITDGSSLYGMTSLGGGSSGGLIFKMNNIVGIEEINQESKFSIFPNPNNGSFSFLIKDRDIDSQMAVEVYNMFGEMVCKMNSNSFEKISEEKFNYKVKIDLSSHLNGIYTLVVKTKEGVSSMKISKIN